MNSLDPFAEKKVYNIQDRPLRDRATPARPRDPCATATPARDRPGNFVTAPLEDIQNAARAGGKAAKKAHKLLNKKEYRK